MSLAKRQHSMLKLALDFDAPIDLDQRVEFLASLRAESQEVSKQLDGVCIERMEAMHEGLTQSEKNLAELKALHETLTAPPWHSGTFLSVVASPSAHRKALVQMPQGVSAVGVSEEVDLDRLKPGDEVLLAHQRNLILAAAPPRSRGGHTANFDRVLENGLWALRWREGTIVVTPSGHLETPARDALVQFDEDLRMAFSVIPKPRDHAYFIEELPDVSLAQVGGQDENMSKLLSAITTSLDPRAAEFGLHGRNRILMVGPPGTGKSLMARAAATELSRQTGRPCRFAACKPSQWESCWVGETQANIRQFFETAARVARDDDTYVVVFLDEVDAVGPARRGRLATSQIDTKFQAALLAELDGFAKNEKVCVVAATNCKDHLDPALLERLNAVELHIDRPNAAAARSIFAIHLPSTLQFNPNGASADATRNTLIEMAVGRLYRETGATLCTLHFRDGERRDVRARELMSGRVIEQICEAAKRTACERAIRDGKSGIEESDLSQALEDAMERLCGTLTVHNVHAFLPDLDHDVDVVRVEPVNRRVKSRHTYMVYEPSEK